MLPLFTKDKQKEMNILSSSNTEVPIKELFNSIYEFKNIEELDKITDRMCIFLQKLFSKIPVTKISPGVYVKKFENISYDPSGLCYDEYRAKKIILAEYEDPGIGEVSIKEQVMICLTGSTSTEIQIKYKE